MSRPAPVRRRGAPPPPARAAALAALGKVLRGGQDVQAALHAVLAEASATGGSTPNPGGPTTMRSGAPVCFSGVDAPHARISPQNAALATELVYGYLRSEIRISWLLRRFLKAPERLPREALLILGVAAHEILHLDRIPDYAAVDWAVSRVRQCFGPGLGKLANAVLRNVARLGADARAPDLYRAALPDTRDFLAVYHAAPPWLADLWCDAYGPERAAMLLAASVQPPVPAVRINAARPGWEALRHRLVSDHGGACCGHAGVRFPAGGFPVTVAPLEHAGLLSRQGAASQEALEALRPETWDGPVWDACCGRGGKALALLERGLDIRLCSDPSARRLHGLRADAARLGLPPPPVARASADEPPCAPGAFRTLLVDAPCSGLGTLARRPDIKLRRTPGDLRVLAALQARILDAAVAALPSGGSLAYITCTVNPAENEAQVERLLTARSGNTTTPAAPLTMVTCHTTPTTSPAREFFFGVLLRKG